MPEKKVVIAAGGTGGHLYPGISLAKELRLKGFYPVFFVRRNDLSKEILQKEGFDYFEVPAMGYPRGFDLKIFVFPFVMLWGVISALTLMKIINPLVVVGMGGYVSFPAVVCARLLNIPSLIHEQNALPGLTNKILAHFAARIALSFEGSLSSFPAKKAVVTGNPVRPDLFRKPETETYEKLGLAEGKFTILVFGGSQGAAAINSAVIDSFEYLGRVKDRIQFLNITGPKDYELTKKEYTVRYIPGRVIAYTHSMSEAYAVSDLIICRSGATTVAELKILNKRSVLIPFPYAAANHQEYNARALEKEGSAAVLLEKDMTPKALGDIILKTFDSGKAAAVFKLPSIFPQELLSAEVVKLAGVKA